MKSFLEAVADAYSSPVSPIRDISDICFVFPNKRSGAFFKKFLRNKLGEGSLFPGIIPISQFVEDLSGRVVDSRIDLLFRLYKAYLEVVAKGISLPEDAGGVSFDRFRLWGETALSDFNEVDMQLVNTSEIFKNVKDFREISSNFLTPEQREVMVRYFGYKGNDFEASGFWRSFGEVDEKGHPIKDSKHIKNKFIYLWQVLAPLYERFHDMLTADGLTTSGGAYRLAYEAIKRDKAAALSPFYKYVFVGFNALSRAERRIFSLLSQIPSPRYADEVMGDFFWDADGPLFAGDDNPAARFVSYNRQKYPSPDWTRPFLETAEPRSVPKINIISSPSNVGQIKLVGNDVDALFDRLKLDVKADKEANRPSGNDYLLKEARIAVVLPDEKLLQPLLYSMPARVGNPNLTMGYPLRQTAVASFVSLLRRMLLRQRRDSEGRYGFFFQDLKFLLAHPFSMTLFGSAKISSFVSGLAKKHKFVVDAEALEYLGPAAKELFHPLPPNVSELDLIDYLDKILEAVSQEIILKGSSFLKGSLENQHIIAYRDALRRVRASIEKYRPGVSGSTIFLLVDRIIAGEAVAFEGEPLQGLQVMGMLETRCLDFEYLFIPSVNEKIMPRRARTRTFIPNAIRYVFGMPPANYQEDVFAYHFFRLLSRAASVEIYYDSRVGDNGANGISRYLLQLEHILAPQALTLTDCSFVLTNKMPEYFPVIKSDQIMSRLESFFIPDSRMNLSASALNRYAGCPLRFFYEYVMKISTDDEPSETVSSTTAGTIVHGVMQCLYLDFIPTCEDDLKRPEYHQFLNPPKLISRRIISSLIADTNRIALLVRRLTNIYHFGIKTDIDRPLTGSAALLAPEYCDQVLEILRHDLEMAPFRLYGCEIEGIIRLPLSDGRAVNCRYAIDRIDRAADDDSAPLRIVDYKTGQVHLEAQSLESIFEGDYKASNIMQLMLYSMILKQKIHEDSPELEPSLVNGVEVVIYDIPSMTTNGTRRPVIAGLELENADSLEVDFAERLDLMLREIFSSEEPFSPDKSGKSCGFCPLTPLCGR
ncbi:MAG: PD-(D/E)XK nuclease family protein [Clostridium sp.]|nr:PD-(D/E)XK nuclease family protein [Prevotella sp.]MCM1429637.1 PD-(D/E)XK nuclease family protein [Clostridium sp.]